MLNTLDMYGICHEIYRDFRGKSVYEKTDENIYVVQQLLGHARTETTKIYLKNNLNQYNDMAADIIAKSIF